MRQRVIREAVQKFSESARLPPIDDLYSMRQSSYPVLVLKELCYTALFANPVLHTKCCEKLPISTPLSPVVKLLVRHLAVN